MRVRIYDLIGGIVGVIIGYVIGWYWAGPIASIVVAAFGGVVGAGIARRIARL